jgi:hypothetical protein
MMLMQFVEYAIKISTINKMMIIRLETSTRHQNMPISHQSISDNKHPSSHPHILFEKSNVCIAVGLAHAAHAVIAGKCG